jgi:chromosome segregation ATPase
MLFSIGDFVTFGSVLLILVVFRALDRNNRSLEKLKRFTDKIMENLSAFVEEKTAQIKDISIELTVNLKTGKELLKRVREAEEALTAKSDGFDGIQKQLADYDRALGDLVSMSERVDQNLKRIQDEGEFVEGVGRRLKDASAQVERIEKEIPALRAEIASKGREGVEAVGARIAELARQIPALREEFAVKGRQSVEAAAAQALGAVEANARSLHEGVADSERRVKDFSAYLARLEARLEQTEKERVAGLVKAADGLEADLKGKRALLMEEASRALETLRQQAGAEIERARKDSAEISAELDSERQAAQERMEASLASLGTSAEAEVARHRQAVEGLAAELASRRASFRGELDAEASALLSAAQGQLAAQEQMLRDAARRGETLEGEVFARLRETLQGDEAALVKSIEKMELRIQEYEGEVDYRFRTLEESGVDIGALEKSLRDSMAGAAAGVREDLKALSATLTTEWKAEVAQVQEEKAAITQGMKELSQGLADLRARAYQDVSEKLRGFEEGFFADLRSRAEGMQVRIQGWQGEVDKRLTDIAVAYALEREKLEKTYLEEARVSFESLKKSSTEEMARVEHQVASLEESVRDRVGTSEESLATLRDSLKAEIDRVRRDSSAAAEKELTAVRDAADAASRRVQRDIEVRLKEIAGELEAGRKELADSLETSRGELASWQGRLRQLVTDAESQAAERFASLTADSRSAIGNIRDEFAAQKEELVVASNGERLTLRNELGELGERLVAFQGELARTTESAVEALHKELDGFQLESQKRMRDVQTEVEGRIKEFKTLLAENREKAEGLQEKLFGKVEEGHRLLSANLVEVDKRVKGFLAQTKLFDRADTLKAGLEGAIEEMKKELGRLQAEKADVAEIEAQLAKTRKVAEEVSGKLTRFMAEKRRIEEMDGDFKKIITISREVDLKMDSLSASNDALQQIQAKVRQFEEMGKSVENGFERLEKKREIITVTAEGVDRNFQRLESLEKGLAGFQKDAEGIESRLLSLKGEIEGLSGAKTDADAVRDAVGRLDGVLGDLEQRLEKAQSAREWLARTETRFEEIGKQAQEQVRLLESIVKAETRKEKGDRGAPPLDKRETVVKLSHQGWSVQEISRVTQLSRGEVELILELAPKA